MVQITLRSIDTRSVLSLVQEVRKFPRINNEQARNLARLAQFGDMKAKKSLTDSSLWYVISMALKYQNTVPGAELSDLIQDGSIGLINAIQSYRPDMPSGFLTYATYCIKDKMLNGLDESKNSIYVPRNSRKLQRQIARATNTYMAEYGCEPTIEDLEEMTGATRECIYAVLHSGVNSVDTEEYPYGADTFAFDESGVFHTLFNKEKTKSLLAVLSDREKDIISKLFGLDEDEWEIKDVAVLYGLSRERVRQIKEKALATMRKKAMGYM